MNKQETDRGIEVRGMILHFIIRYLKAHGYPPTVQEIGDGVGLKSKSTVHAHLTKMISDGVLETDAPLGSSRAIRVPGYRFVKV